MTNQLWRTFGPIEGTATITATVGTTVRTESNVTLPWTRTVQVPGDHVAVKLVVVSGPDGAEVHGKFTIKASTVREGNAAGPGSVLTITDS